jgi:hypothetical protein
MRKHRFIGFVLAATTVAGPISLATTTHASASVALNIGMPASWRLLTINVPISPSIARPYAQMTRPIPAVPFSDVIAPAPLDLSSREVQQPSDEARLESVRLKQATLAYATALRQLAAVSTTAHRSEPVPVSAPESAASSDVWAELRQCESGGNYAEDTGNGFYGAYQFAASTWAGLGYPGLPNDAAPSVQDAAAAQLQARSGWGQWPACSAQLGL